MYRLTSHLYALGAVTIITLTGPDALRALEPDTVVVPTDSVEALVCEEIDDESSVPLGFDETLELAARAVDVGRAEPGKEKRKCYFRMAASLARRLVFEDPGHADARYWYAAALGLRAAEEGGRTQVGLAQRAHEQARLTLTIAPDHAGAQHVLGRLHAAVMRLSSLKRFVATRLLGGKVLSGASWESAEELLASAARLAPEVPEHHYQLAMLYLDTERPGDALVALEAVLACPRISPADQASRDHARSIVRRLRGEAAG